jgi:hypothetical protein
VCPEKNVTNAVLHVRHGGTVIASSPEDDDGSSDARQPIAAAERVTRESSRARRD